MRPATFPLVLIVASRGGVAAISRVLESLPRDFAAAVVIVLHRAELPGHAWTQVLQRTISLPVRDVHRGERLEPGIVYVAPARVMCASRPRASSK
jgi:two-component system chemotaxis response regulator CheB